MKFMLEDALKRGGPQEVAKVVGSMKDKSPFIQYMNMLNAAEQQRMLYGGQMLAGGYESGVIKGVDLAMYDAKQTGKNKVVKYEK